MGIHPVQHVRGLSQRRRDLLVVAALLALVAVAAAVGAVNAPARRPVPVQDRPGPVVLVPGYGGGGMGELAEEIRATGRDAIVVVLPGDGTGDLHEQAQTLDRYVAEALRSGVASVDVVGHSAGGVVARLWVQESDGAHKARRIVTLGSPHHGAQLAAAAGVAAPGSCPAACVQLAPGSRLLESLRTPVPTPPAWLSVWTTQDGTVTPVDSGRLEGALNVPLQSVCPAARVSHAGLVTSDVVARIVLEALGPGPLRAPNSGAC